MLPRPALQGTVHTRTIDIVSSSIQPRMSSSARPRGTAEDTEMEDGPPSPTLDLLWPLPGAQQSVGLPVCPRVAVTAKTQMVAKKTGRRMEVDPIPTIAAERPVCLSCFDQGQ